MLLPKYIVTKLQTLIVHYVQVSLSTFTNIITAFFHGQQFASLMSHRYAYRVLVAVRCSMADIF